MNSARTVLRWASLAVVAVAIAAQMVSPLIALVLGIAIAVSFGAPRRSETAARHLLALSVVALGFGVDLGAVLDAGRAGLVATIAMLALTFATGSVLARIFGVRQDVALLVTAGTAICGGSAIAAVAPLIRARATDVAAALGVVFALNALALAVFPTIGTSLGMDASVFGRWCALAIHDTSSVVGAAATHGREALEIATVTKLARVLWIVPIGFVIVRWRARGQETTPTARRAPALPWFLVAFLAAATLGTLLPAARPWCQHVAQNAPTGMTLALLAIGLGMTRSLSSVLGPTLGFGVVLWAALAGSSLLFLAIATPAI